MLGQQDNFIQLLTAQFDLAHASTSFFHQNMWNQTCPPQHMNLPNEEDILVRVAEHEEVETKISLRTRLMRSSMDRLLKPCTLLS